MWIRLAVQQGRCSWKLQRDAAGTAVHPPAEVSPAADRPKSPPEAVPAGSSQEIAESQQLVTLLQSLGDRLAQLESQQRQRLEEMQQLAIELAVAVAARVLQDRAEAGQLPLVPMIQAAIERLGVRQGIVIRLHPLDCELLQKTDAMQHLGKCQLQADAQLRRGDCVVLSGELSVAGLLHHQLDALREHLRGVLLDAEIERRKAQAGDRLLRRFPDRRQTA
ncbi:MAG: hypothetical protein C4297_10085 [Gemmataceae bacterium]